MRFLSAPKLSIFQVLIFSSFSITAGLATALAQPPFDITLSTIFAPFPLLSFVIFLPLLFLSAKFPTKRALTGAYLFGLGASLAQFSWIANVNMENERAAIIGGMCLLAALFALQWLLLGAIWRRIDRTYGWLSIILFPSIWTIFDWLRTLGEMSFPWGFAGYNLTGILPFAQLASLTGVWGLTWFVVAVNVILFRLIDKKESAGLAKWIPIVCAVLVFAAVFIWGTYRISHADKTAMAKIALMQNNMDQGHWDARHSLDSALARSRDMINSVASVKPALVVFPESGIYCYYATNAKALCEIRRWINTLKVPIAFGSLHYERAPVNPYYKYSVYNSVFVETPDSAVQRYDKIRLVPFSEALPFTGAFPILSRVNLGQSDFSRGKHESILSVHGIPGGVAPVLCYEITYPDFIRHRAVNGAGLILNLTNDGWFGHSSAPFQHAAMSRMRSIENGLPQARCANSGISFCCDAVGRMYGKTELFKRVVLTTDLPMTGINTIYRKFGDWFPLLCAMLSLLSIMSVFIRRKA